VKLPTSNDDDLPLLLFKRSWDRQNGMKQNISMK